MILTRLRGVWTLLLLCGTFTAAEASASDVVGASVEVRGVSVTQGKTKEDLGSWLEHLRTKKTFYDAPGPHMRLDAASAGLARSVRCGRDGKFRLDGFGRERLVKLRFSGPT